eukprot:scaffold1293_cov375-Prasinococcus_capsulatus_cf.AAC.19
MRDGAGGPLTPPSAKKQRVFERQTSSKATPASNAALSPRHPTYIQGNGVGSRPSQAPQQPPAVPSDRNPPAPAIGKPRPLLAGVISHPVVEQLVDVLLIAAAHAAMKTNSTLAGVPSEKPQHVDAPADKAATETRPPGSNGVRDLSPVTASLLCEEQDVLTVAPPPETTPKQDSSWTSRSYAAQEHAVLTEFNHCLQKVVALGKRRAAVWTQSVASQQQQQSQNSLAKPVPRQEQPQ